MLITNARIISMCDKDYDCGYIKIEDKKIVEVGDMSDLSQQGDIDASGMYVMPGMIDAHCHIGLFGDGIGFEGEDGNEETDPLTPHIRALDAIDMRDRCFEDARNSGVTTVVVSPGSANVFGGQIAAIKTYGNRVDNVIVKEPLGLKVAFGENPKMVHNKKDQSPVTRMATAAMIRQMLLSAQHYEQKIKNVDGEAPNPDLKLEALLEVLENKIPLHAHAHRADDIFTAIRLGREFGIDVKIVHGTEGHLIVEELAKEGVEVMVGPSLCDRSKPELANLTFETAGILQNAGIKVALITDHPVIPINYLLLTAQLAVKNGMTNMGALRAITCDAADIAGIGNVVGRIKCGFDADLVIMDKHPLDFSSAVYKVIIDGIVI